MYSTEERRRALDLWFERLGEVGMEQFVAELGYPSRQTMSNWVRADPRRDPDKATYKSRSVLAKLEAIRRVAEGAEPSGAGAPSGMTAAQVRDAVDRYARGGTAELLATTKENAGGNSGFAAKRLVVRVAAALLGGADVECEVEACERAARKSAVGRGGEVTFAAVGNMGRNWYAPAGLFGRSVRVRFEDLELPIPAGYDDLLRITYGGYMQLPPVEQRFPPSLIQGL